MEAPPPPRRVLVANVTGELGARIQAWRERHDLKQAWRLPPHLTVCYRPPSANPDEIEAQVRHAFPTPIQVRLGPVGELAHREIPMIVTVHDTAELDRARERLFDGTYVQMGGRTDWPWHITCVRYGEKRDRAALIEAASHELALDHPWTISMVSYMELRQGRYESLADWLLGLPK
jgi:hypothetical protein